MKKFNEDHLFWIVWVVAIVVWILFSNTAPSKAANSEHVFPIDFKSIHTSRGLPVLDGWYYEWRGGRQHRAFDIAAPVGTTVNSVVTGKVVTVNYQYNRPEDPRQAYGNFVVIQDSWTGELWLYAHLNSYCVKVGDEVNMGDKIGEVGYTGMSYPCAHLHLEKRDMFGKRIPIASDFNIKFLRKGVDI